MTSFHFSRVELDCPVGLSAVASRLTQGGVGAVEQAPRWLTLPQFVAFMSLAADRLGTMPRHPSAAPSPRWSPGSFVVSVPLPEAPP